MNRYIYIQMGNFQPVLTGPTVLSRRRYRQQPALSGSGLAGSSPGTEAAACDQTAVVGRIYPTLPEPVLQLLPVL